jgi:nicotinamidase-related amidase
VNDGLEANRQLDHLMSQHTGLDLSRSALLTIDTQCDFTLPDGAASIPGTLEVVPNIRRLVMAYRERSLPIVHVVRLYRPDGSNVDACRRSLVESGARIVCPGSDGAELVPELRPSLHTRLDPALLLDGQLQLLAESEWALYKPRWGAFYATRLEEHLGALGVNTIVVTGCNFPNCPRTTVYEASERDFRLALVADAVSGLYERGSCELAGIGAQLLGTDELLSALPRP